MKSNTVNHSLEMPLWWNKPLAEALDMAIKALEQETVSKEVYDHEYYLRNEFEIKIARLEHDKNEVLDKIDEIITDALDKSTDQKESQALRWVLDKISEVT